MAPHMYVQGQKVSSKCRSETRCGSGASSVTRRRQSKPSNTQETKQRSTQQSTQQNNDQPQEALAVQTQRNQTPTQYTLVRDTMILHTPTPQAASSKSTHARRTYTGCKWCHLCHFRRLRHRQREVTRFTRELCGRGWHCSHCELQMV